MIGFYMSCECVLSSYLHVIIPYGSTRGSNSHDLLWTAPRSSYNTIQYNTIHPTTIGVYFDNHVRFQCYHLICLVCRPARILVNTVPHSPTHTHTYESAWYIPVYNGLYRQRGLLRPLHPPLTGGSAPSSEHSPKNSDS